MLFWSMLNEASYELHSGNSFNNKLVVFVTIVVKSDIFTIVVINARGGNDWASKISTYVFGNNLRVAFVGFGINIESIFMVAVTLSFN